LFERVVIHQSTERGGIRVSLAMFNTVGDIERLIEMLRIGLTRGTLAATEQIE